MSAFKNNIGWEGGSIYKRMCMEMFLWAGKNRLFIMNTGGSHHFSAARYIAKRLKIKHSVYGKLRRYSINSAAVTSLCRDFDMFLMQGIGDNRVYEFNKIMQTIEAPWLQGYMPKPFCNGCVVLMPKFFINSIKAATVLRQVGLFDLGDYLQKLAGSQNKQAGICPPVCG